LDEPVASITSELRIEYFAASRRQHSSHTMLLVMCAM